MLLILQFIPAMEEPGEQCTVVFALIVLEPASESVYVGLLHPLPTSRFRNNLCKDDSGLFSRFLHDPSPSNRCLSNPVSIHGFHRLNMDSDLQSLFGPYVHSYGWDSACHPPHLGSYTRALLVSQERRHLLGTPWWIDMLLHYLHNISQY